MTQCHKEVNFKLTASCSYVCVCVWRGVLSVYVCVERCTLLARLKYLAQYDDQPWRPFLWPPEYPTYPKLCILWPESSQFPIPCRLQLHSTSEANGVGNTEYPNVEQWNWVPNSLLYKTSLRDQKTDSAVQMSIFVVYGFWRVVIYKNICQD